MKIEDTWMWEPNCNCETSVVIDNGRKLCIRCGKAYMRFEAQENIDASKLDEGIRRLVVMLRDYGFNTTDSGDGSKADEMEGAVPFTMVAMRVENPEHLTMHARRLMRILNFGHDIKFGQGENDPRIEATYTPSDNIAVIVLANVTDKMLKLEQP